MMNQPSIHPGTVMGEVVEATLDVFFAMTTSGRGGKGGAGAAGG